MSSAVLNHFFLFQDIPPLSPLPVVKSQSASPRRVSSKHSIYLSPHKPTLHATPMATGLSYSFQKSPAKVNFDVLVLKFICSSKIFNFVCAYLKGNGFNVVISL